MTDKQWAIDVAAIQSDLFGISIVSETIEKHLTAEECTVFTGLFLLSLKNHTFPVHLENDDSEDAKSKPYGTFTYKIVWDLEPARFLAFIASLTLQGMTQTVTVQEAIKALASV